MTNRRLVGIDLGIASAHTVRVLDETGRTIAKRKAVPTVESLTEIETAALAGTPGGTRLEVVMEPTGPAWLPIAVFFSDRGHVVHRVSSAKASDLRKFLSRHTKTNGIDADTLARLALIDPAELRPLVLADGERAGLDRRVRACDRLTQAASRHKVRIKDLVRQLFPMTPLTGDLGVADLVMRRQTPYVICDTDGRPVTPAEAKIIIAEHFAVPAEVRARRRSKKMGKAPQAARTGRHERGNLPHQPSFSASIDQVNRRTA